MEQQEIILKQAEEIAQLKLKIERMEKDEEIKTLKNRIQELESRRFLIEVKDDNESVIQSRMIHLGILEPEFLNRLIQQKEATKFENGRETLDAQARKRWKTYKTILSVLGTLMSNAYRVHNHGRRPNIASRVGRPNYYLESDFKAFGDSVIHQYFSQMSLRHRINRNIVQKYPVIEYFVTDEL